MFLLFQGMGICAGYVAARIHKVSWQPGASWCVAKHTCLSHTRGLLLVARVCSRYPRSPQTFNGKQWQRVTLKTAFVFPATFYAIVFLLNLFVWAEGSSQAIPFGDMVLVLVSGYTQRALLLLPNALSH